MSGKNIQELIDYLETIKDISGVNTKVLVDGEKVENFDEVIFMDHVNSEIDIISSGFDY